MLEKIGNKVLWFFYFVIVGIFIYLSIWHKDKDYILSVNTYVSIGMLVIVGAFVLYAWGKCLRTADKMIGDLKDVSNDIKRAGNVNNGFLWDKYRTQELFHIDELQKAYNNYRQEMLRLEKNNAEGYKCDIEDFINETV